MVIGELRGCPAIAVLVQSQAVGMILLGVKCFLICCMIKQGNTPKSMGRKACDQQTLSRQHLQVLCCHSCCIPELGRGNGRAARSCWYLCDSEHRVQTWGFVCFWLQPDAGIGQSELSGEMKNKGVYWQITQASLQYFYFFKKRVYL